MAKDRIQVSLTEYIKSLGRWGWVVLVGILAGVYGLASSIWDVPLIIPSWLWILLLFVGLTIVPFIPFHKLRLEKLRVEEKLEAFENSLPSIIVTLYSTHNCVQLCVANNGAAAEFMAKAEKVEAGQLSGISWPINWDGSSSEKQSIFKGSSHILNIASRVIGGYVGPGSDVPFVRFHSSKQSLGIEMGKETYTDHIDLPRGESLAEIQVTITSNPQLRSPFHERYRIKLANDSILAEPVEAVAS